MKKKTNYCPIVHIFAFLFLALSNKTPAQSRKHPIKVLIIDGFSNHDWKQTSKVTKDILEETGKYKVDISTAPSEPNDTAWTTWSPNFSNYKVIIQNTNNIQNKLLKWPPNVEKSLANFVRNGGGLYILHSANNAFPHWAAYDTMIGLGWRPKETGYAIQIDSMGKTTLIPPATGKSTSHGKRFNATIRILTPHPINKGFPKQWVSPSIELYTYARGPIQNLTILSYCIDSSTKIGWPVDWVVRYGKGRVYNSSMGHLWKGDTYPLSYRCIGFQTLMIRATEWLASGKSHYHIPKNFPKYGEMVVREESDYPKKK